MSSFSGVLYPGLNIGTECGFCDWASSKWSCCWVGSWWLTSTYSPHALTHEPLQGSHTHTALEHLQPPLPATPPKPNIGKSVYISWSRAKALPNLLSVPLLPVNKNSTERKCIGSQRPFTVLWHCVMWRICVYKDGKFFKFKKITSGPQHLSLLSELAQGTTAQFLVKLKPEPSPTLFQ